MRNDTSPWGPARSELAEWHSAAACRDPGLELSFIAITQEQIEAVTQVCRRCPVRMQCLQWALGNRHVTGIWGGLTEAELRLLVRR